MENKKRTNIVTAFFDDLFYMIALLICELPWLQVKNKITEYKCKAEEDAKYAYFDVNIGKKRKYRGVYPYFKKSLKTKKTPAHIEVIKQKYDQLEGPFSGVFKNVIQEGNIDHTLGMCYIHYRDLVLTKSWPEVGDIRNRFLNDARRTLYLYFAIEDENKLEKKTSKLEKLFMEPSNADIFLKGLRDEYEFNGKEYRIDLYRLAGLMNQLRNSRIVCDVSDKQVIESLKDINISVSPSTFSEGKKIPLRQREIQFLNRIFPSISL